MPNSRSKSEFKARVNYWADKLDITVNAITIRPMARKWASCSTNGNLNFNLELLEVEHEIADYVIVHELLHFYVPNHGKLWKSLMTVHLGDYKPLAEKLRKYPLSFSPS